MSGTQTRLIYSNNIFHDHNDEATAIFERVCFARLLSCSDVSLFGLGEPKAYAR